MNRRRLTDRSRRHLAGLLALAVLGLLAGCERRTAPAPAPAVAVSVAPPSARLQPRATADFVAAVTNTLDTRVTWSVLEAGGGTVDPLGLYVAPGTAGSFHVVATSVADPSKQGSAAITVVPAATLAIAPNPASVAVGSTQLFTVTPPSAVNWAVTQVAAAATAPAYPVKVSANGRYLVDQAGRPWRVQADAAWLMSSNATPAQVDTYLATRKAQGFNAFYLMAMVHPGGYGAAPTAPGNATYGAPFSTANDFLTPIETYWAWIDTIIDKAEAQGLAVMLAYNYLGYAGGNQGWTTVVAGMTSARATAWGTWLGNRYKSKPNVIWMHAGDYTPPQGSTLEARVVAIIGGIRAAGATQVAMAEMSGNDGIPTVVSPAIASADPLMMNSYYGYGTGGHGETYEQADQAYRLAAPRPTWAQETGYEGENNTGGFPSDTVWGCRRSQWWSALAGGTAGHGFGSIDAWQWQNFPAGLSTPGASHVSKAFTLLGTLPWWDLRPSGTGTGFAGKTLVTSGAGTWGNQNVVTSAVTSDGGWLLAYLPGTNGGSASATLSINMSAMAGTTRARWWNPTSGAFTAIGTGYTNTGTQAFTSPGSNGAGNDWVLVLDAASGSACGTVDATGLYTAPLTLPVGLTCQVTATLQADAGVSATAVVTLH